MLNGDEKREIEHEIARSYDRRAACIGALRVVQRHRRWVSDEAIEDVAAILEMAPGELEAVADFYSLIFRHPVGEHVLKVCDGAVCWMLGSLPCEALVLRSEEDPPLRRVASAKQGQTVMEYLETKLGVKAGGTTGDGKFTLLPICCLGDCDHAPVMLYDDIMVRNLTPEVIDRVLEHGPEVKTNH